MTWQTCQAEVERGVATAALRHLGRLLGACLDSLPGLRSDTARFTVLCIANRIVDINIWRQACCPSMDADDDDEVEEDDASTAAETRSTTATTVEKRPSVLSTKRLTRCDSQELAAQINLDRVLNFSAHNRPGDVSGHSHTASQRHSRPHSWKNKSPFRHQESQRSIVSSAAGGGGGSTATYGAVPTVTVMTGDDGREPSCSAPGDNEGPSAVKSVPTAAVPPVVDTEDSASSTPLGVLSSRDPVLLLGVLQEAVGRQKANLGAPGRHRCSPSVRCRHCAPHCLQILSARLFAVMCHDASSQRQVIDGDHVRTLVDALDPNHDPVSYRLRWFYYRIAASITDTIYKALRYFLYTCVMHITFLLAISRMFRCRFNSVYVECHQWFIAIRLTSYGKTDC